MTDSDNRSPSDDYATKHAALRADLKARLAGAITSAATDGRTVEDPAVAAEYAVNALMEYPEGQALIHQIATHLSGSHTKENQGA